MFRIKRGIAIFLVILLVVALTCCFAVASTNASDYLAEYGAALIATEKGKYDIFYDLTATNTSDSLGVSQIKIYKSDGTYIATIKGTIANGLIIEEDYTHTGVYTRSGISGNSYYAEVTVFAKRGSGSDSRTITTNTITVK